MNPNESVRLLTSLMSGKLRAPKLKSNDQRKQRQRAHLNLRNVLENSTAIRNEPTILSSKCEAELQMPPGGASTPMETPPVGVSEPEEPPSDAQQPATDDNPVASDLKTTEEDSVQQEVSVHKNEDEHGHVSDVMCDVCGRVCKSKAGLSRHKKVH